MPEIHAINGELDRFYVLLEKLETKIDKLAMDNNDSLRRVHEKIDADAEKTRLSMGEFALRLENVVTRFEGHEQRDEERFADVSSDLKEANEDRRGMWRAIGGGTIGGTAGGALLTRILDALGVGGPHQ